MELIIIRSHKWDVNERFPESSSFCLLSFPPVFWTHLWSLGLVRYSSSPPSPSLLTAVCNCMKSLLWGESRGTEFCCKAWVLSGCVLRPPLPPCEVHAGPSWLPRTASSAEHTHRTQSKCCFCSVWQWSWSNLTHKVTWPSGAASDYFIFVNMCRHKPHINVNSATRHWQMFVMSHFADITSLPIGGSRLSVEVKEFVDWSAD